MTCTVKKETRGIFTVAFFRNGIMAKTNYFMKVFKPQHVESNVEHLILRVHQSSESRDSGEYKCTAMDSYNNTNSAISTMTFVNGPVIELNPMNPVIRLDQGKKLVRFVVEYKAFPNATFFIYNPNNKKISNDEDVIEKTKYFVKIEEESLKFTVKKPTLTDHGTYLLVANTVGKNVTTSLRLVVSGWLNIFQTVFRQSVYLCHHQKNRQLASEMFMSKPAKKCTSSAKF